MKRILACLGLTLLTACGADGEPETPTMNTSINVGTHGASVGISLSQGPFTLGLGL